MFKRNFTLILILIISNFITAQKSSFIYELKYKTRPDSLIVDKINFYLDINNEKSVFRSEMFRKSDSLRIKRGFPNDFKREFNNNQLYTEKNRDTDIILKYVFVPVVYATFAINIKDNPDWSIDSKKIKIGDYNTQKATTEYGGRKWTGWFTTDINIPEEPYVFKRLPGLIVKISDEKENFNFELIQIKNFEWEDLHMAKYQKLITWEDFKKIQKNFYINPYSSLKKGDILQEISPNKFSEVDLNKATKELLEIIRPKYYPLEINHKIDL